MKYYTKTTQEIIDLLSTDLSCGLDDKEVKKRIKQYGKNIIFDNGKKESSKTALKLLYDPISLLLLIAALICLSISSYSSAILIFLIWTINIFITTAAYFKAEDILYSVKSYGIPRVKVIRNSRICIIDSRLLVPGDIVIVEAGDIICADCKVIESDNLYAYENDLCGTKSATEKFPSENTDSVSLSEMHGILFASSSIIKGSGIAVVLNCGVDTEIVSTAGLIPICGKHQPELFLTVKRRCRKWAIITTVVALLIFVIKLLVAPVGIFDVFLLVISLMGASMSESMLPLTQIAAARDIAASAQSGNNNRVIIKNAGAIENLKDISVFVATEEITEFETMDLLHLLKNNNIRVIILSNRENAFTVATKYGASIATSEDELESSKGALCIYIAQTTKDKLRVISYLKNCGECIGALTTKLENIRLLDSADVAFTYGKFKYKTNEYSKIYIEKFSGSHNQILSRVSDVICEENVLSTNRAVNCAKSIYQKVSLASSFLISMQISRAFLCVISLLTVTKFIDFTHILIGGMFFDLTTVLCMAFLSPNSLTNSKFNYENESYIYSIVDSFIISLSSISCSLLPILMGISTNGTYITTISFIIFMLYPVIFLIFNTKNRIATGAVKVIIFYCIFIAVIITLLALLPLLRDAVLFNFNIITVAFSAIGTTILSFLIWCRRKFLNFNKA